MDAILVETLWGERNGAVQIERLAEFDAAAKELSDFIRDLQLDAATNDALVGKMVKQMNLAEYNAYLQGFLLGFQFGQSQKEV